MVIYLFFINLIKKTQKKQNFFCTINFYIQLLEKVKFMSFNIEIIEEKKNPIIDRIELKVRVDHYGNGTPNRLEVKKKVASLQGSDEQLTIIKNIQTYFGSTQDLAEVYVYDSEKELQFFEPFHIQVRNLPKEKREEIYKLKKKKEPYKHLFDYG